jgi:anti-sigma-K factor RskA
MSSSTKKWVLSFAAVSATAVLIAIGLTKVFNDERVLQPPISRLLEAED